MKYKFPHRIRLTNKAQFSRVFKKKQQKIYTEIFTIYRCDNNFNYPRLGIIVPKSSINNAATRNYFKRIIREKFRVNQYNLKNIDIVIFINKGAKAIPKKELSRVLEYELNKITL